MSWPTSVGIFCLAQEMKYVMMLLCFWLLSQLLLELDALGDTRVNELVEVLYCRW
jgi:hypothetical protein